MQIFYIFLQKYISQTKKQKLFAENFCYKIFLCDIFFMEQLNTVLTSTYRRLVDLWYSETRNVASLLHNEFKLSSKLGFSKHFQGERDLTSFKIKWTKNWEINLMGENSKEYNKAIYFFTFVSFAAMIQCLHKNENQWKLTEKINQRKITNITLEHWRFYA